jgi:hypothetical protein
MHEPCVHTTCYRVTVHSITQVCTVISTHHRTASRSQPTQCGIQKIRAVLQRDLQRKLQRPPRACWTPWHVPAGPSGLSTVTCDASGYLIRCSLIPYATSLVHLHEVSRTVNHRLDASNILETVSSGTGRLAGTFDSRT